MKYKNIISFCLLFLSTTVFANPITIVAAENFYGNIAHQIGGPYVEVVSIMNNPNQDPHLFSSNVAIAKTIADADLIVSNGIDYDAWIDNLLSPTAKQNKQVIIIAQLLGKKPGDDPHIWYDPETMLVYAEHLTMRLSTLGAEHADYFQRHLNIFKQQHNTLLKKIADLKSQYEGTPVIATEPIFNYMADALGLNMQGKNFQISIMNEVAPGAKDTEDFEDQLTKQRVKVLIYNNQVTNPVTERMKSLAKQTNIPIVGVSETEPLHQNYFAWMNKQLDELAAALAKQETLH